MQTAAPEIPRTGPAAIEYALRNLDTAAAEKRAWEQVRSGKVSKRDAAVKTLNILEGLKRNQLTPAQLLIKSVPVIPAEYRPFSVLGDTFVQGDANDLYKGVFDQRQLFDDARKTFGDEGAGEEALQLYDAVKATFGHGDPVNPKTRERGVSGFLKHITGASPKTGWFQKRMISKPMDNVARGVIVVNPDLSLNEVGVPEEMAWSMYSPYIQQHLVRRGMNQTAAVQHMTDRTKEARKALERVIEDRYVVYSRAPAWHRFSVLAGRPKLVDGHAIQINPLVTAGLNADFDGDTINLHVPSTPEAVQEAKEKLLPDKMIFSIRDQDKIVPAIKHEQVLGLFAAQQRPAQAMHVFPTEGDALRAIRSGSISLADDVHIGNNFPIPQPMAPQPTATAAPAPQPR